MFFLGVLASLCEDLLLYLIYFHTNPHGLCPQRSMKISRSCHCEGAPGDCGNLSLRRLPRSPKAPSQWQATCLITIKIKIKSKKYLFSCKGTEPQRFWICLFSVPLRLCVSIFFETLGMLLSNFNMGLPCAMICSHLIIPPKWFNFRLVALESIVKKAKQTDCFSKTI